MTSPRYCFNFSSGFKSFTRKKNATNHSGPAPCMCWTKYARNHSDSVAEDAENFRCGGGLLDYVQILYGKKGSQQK